MQSDKIGNIIKKLRLEKNYTQKNLADKMNISDKTISKWERGLGCPDLSLINELSEILEIDIQKLLEGDLCTNQLFNGNFKKSKFYICPNCMSINITNGEAKITCCSRTLKATVPKEDNDSQLQIEKLAHEIYLSSNHPMTKDHYISFVGTLAEDSIFIKKLYPQWELKTYIPLIKRGYLFWYCNIDGLFIQKI